MASSTFWTSLSAGMVIMVGKLSRTRYSSPLSPSPVSLVSAAELSPPLSSEAPPALLSEALLVSPPPQAAMAHSRHRAKNKAMIFLAFILSSSIVLSFLPARAFVIVNHAIFFVKSLLRNCTAL